VVVEAGEGGTMNITAYELAQRYIGIAELSSAGRDHPLIQWWLSLCSGFDIESPDETPWCMSGDVEILTSSGFTRFDQLSDFCHVAQVDPLFGISFTRPLRVIRKKYCGPIVFFSSRSLSMRTDPEHRFWGIWNKAGAMTGQVEKRPIRELSSVLHVPRVASRNEVDDLEFSDREIGLMAAFLSDGFLRTGGTGRIAIQVSKQRKIDALHSLVPSNWYRAKIAYGQSTVPLTTFEYQIPAWLSSAFVDYKKPKWSILTTWSRRQLQHFVLSYATFDGSARGDRRMIYTSSPDLRDWLQAAVTLAGFHSSQRQGSQSPISGRPCYTISFSTAKRTRTIRRGDFSIESGGEDLFCVEVPTGVILIRDPNGTVLPVGNCSAFVNGIAWELRLPRSKSAMARSWLGVGQAVEAVEGFPSGPQISRIGFDVVVLMRGSGDQPGPDIVDAPGHVGFFGGWDGGRVNVLGGNQGNAVSVQSFPKDRILGIRRLRSE